MELSDILLMYTFRNIFSAIWGRAISTLACYILVPGAHNRERKTALTGFPSPFLLEYYLYEAKYYTLYRSFHLIWEWSQSNIGGQTVT